VCPRPAELRSARQPRGGCPHVGVWG
jgi:hypothetical protein